VSLQGYSVLRLFLIADLLCATAVVPVLMGLWSRTGPLAAVAGCVAGLVGAVVPGWWASGSLWAGIVAASFPSSIPTLGPFLGALIASTVVCYGLSLLRPQGTLPCSTTS
jgi:Na+/proline symporter